MSPTIARSSRSTRNRTTATMITVFTGCGIGTYVVRHQAATPRMVAMIRNSMIPTAPSLGALPRLDLDARPVQQALLHQDAIRLQLHHLTEGQPISLGLALARLLERRRDGQSTAYRVAELGLIAPALATADTAHQPTDVGCKGLAGAAHFNHVLRRQTEVLHLVAPELPATLFDLELHLEVALQGLVSHYWLLSVCRPLDSTVASMDSIPSLILITCKGSSSMWYIACIASGHRCRTATGSPGRSNTS